MATVSLSTWALFSLLATLTNLAFLVFVLFKNPRSVVNRAWSFAILCLLLWGCGQTIMRITSSAAAAELALTISGIGFCLLPSPFLHFALAFTGHQSLLQQRRTYFLLYVPGITFSLLHVFGYLTAAVQLKSGFASNPLPGYWPYIFWLEIYFIYGLYLCFRKWQQATSKRARRQALFVIFGVVIPLVSGSIVDAFLPLAGVDTPRITVSATAITAAIVTFAIVKYRLMSLTPETTAATVIDTIVDLLAVTDLNGKVIFANKAFREALKESVRKGDDLHIAHFIEDSSVVLSAAQMSCVSEDKSHLFEVRFKSNDGLRYPAQLSISPIHDRGECIGFVLVARDISEQKRMQEQLNEAARKRTADLERFAISMQRAQEEERRRISLELHDDLGQRLTALKMNMEFFEDTLPVEGTIAKRKLKEFQCQIDKMVIEVRRISANLRPSALDDFGLEIALRMLLKEFEKVHNIKVTFQSFVRDNYDEQIEIALYRIAQEALSNIAKYADARKVKVKLWGYENEVVLTIQDDGIGFDVKQAQQNAKSRELGLISMKERAILLNGTFQLQSSYEKGAKINVRIPLKSPRKDAQNQNINC